MVPNGATLNDYISWVSPGDILSLAPGGTYTLDAAEYGFNTLRGGSAARYTRVLGNGASIVDGVAGLSCTTSVPEAGYKYFENLYLVNNRSVSVNITGANDIKLVNINPSNQLYPAFIDAWKMKDCDRIDIDGGSTGPMIGGLSCDGIEFWGPCNDCTVDNHTVHDFAGEGQHNAYEVYGNLVDEICDNIVFTNCHAENMTCGFSNEGGPNSIAHTNIKAIGCTTTNMATYDAQGIQGATMLVQAGTLLNRDGSVTEF